MDADICTFICSLTPTTVMRVSSSNGVGLINEVLGKSAKYVVAIDKLLNGGWDKECDV